MTQQDGADGALGAVPAPGGPGAGSGGAGSSPDGGAGLPIDDGTGGGGGAAGEVILSTLGGVNLRGGGTVSPTPASGMLTLLP
jgi:hypothetical protein